MFRLRKLTPVRGRNGCGADVAAVFRSAFFPIFIRDWRRLETSLTCRQGDFAEDLSG
jgi:hypothetical protein